MYLMHWDVSTPAVVVPTPCLCTQTLTHPAPCSRRRRRLGGKSKQNKGQRQHNKGTKDLVKNFALTL